jgi:hypothetical protein
METSEELESSVLEKLCEEIEEGILDLQKIRSELCKISDRGREKWLKHSPLISAVVVISTQYLIIGSIQQIHMYNCITICLFLHPKVTLLLVPQKQTVFQALLSLLHKPCQTAYSITV